MMHGSDSRDDEPSSTSSVVIEGSFSEQIEDIDGIESRVISADESGVTSGVVSDEVANLFCKSAEESVDDRPTDLIIDELLAVGESLAAKYEEFEKFGSFTAEEPRDNVKTKLREVMKSLNASPSSKAEPVVGLPADSVSNEAQETMVCTPLIIESKDMTSSVAYEKDDIETNLVLTLSASEREVIQINLVPTPVAVSEAGFSESGEMKKGDEKNTEDTPAEAGLPESGEVKKGDEKSTEDTPAEAGLPGSGVMKSSDEKSAEDTPAEAGLLESGVMKANDKNNAEAMPAEAGLPESGAMKASDEKSAEDIPAETNPVFFQIGFQQPFLTSFFAAAEPSGNGKPNDTNESSGGNTVTDKPDTCVEPLEEAKDDSNIAKTEQAAGLMEPVKDWISSLNIDFSALDPVVLTRDKIDETNPTKEMPNQASKEVNKPVEASKEKDDKPVGESSKDKTSTKKKETKEKLSKSQKNNPTIRSRAMNFIKSRLQKNPANQNGAEKQNNGDKAISQPPNATQSYVLESMRNKVEEHKARAKEEHMARAKGEHKARANDNVDSSEPTEDVLLTGAGKLGKKSERKDKKKAKKEKKTMEEKAMKKARKASTGNDTKFKKKTSRRSTSRHRKSAAYQTAGCEKGDFSDVVGLIEKDIREVAGDVGMGVQDFFGIVCADGQPSMSMSEHTDSSFSSDDSSKSAPTVLKSSRNKARKSSAGRQRMASPMRSRAMSPMRHKSMKSIRSPSPMRQGTLSPIRKTAITPLEPLSERSGMQRKVDHSIDAMSMIASSSSESVSIIEAREPQYERGNDLGRDLFFVECKRCENACDDRDFVTYASNSSGSLDDSLQIDVPKVLTPRRLQTKEVSQKRVKKKDNKETKKNKKEGKKKTSTAPSAEMMHTAHREFKIRESRDDHLMNPDHAPERLDLENISTLTDLHTFADAPSPTKRKGGVKKLFGLVRRKNKDKLHDERDIFENLANRSEKKAVMSEHSEKFGNSIQEEDYDDSLDDIDKTSYHSELSETIYSESETTELRSIFEHKANDFSSHRARSQRRSHSARGKRITSDHSESPRRRRLQTLDSESSPRRSRLSSDFTDSFTDY